MNFAGFHGEISNVHIFEESCPDSTKSEMVEKDIDLVGMAQSAMNFLKNNPRPNLEYECRFNMDLMRYKPCPDEDEHDDISVGDTDNRMDWEYGYMKEMCGDTSADEVTGGVRKRIMGYLREDGNCWTIVKSGSNLDGIYALPWTTGKLLVSLCEDYRRNRDEKLRPLCRHIFEAIRKPADWIDGRAYYSGGHSFFDNDGWAISDASPYHPAMTLESVVKYYEVFNDQEALDFAIAFAEGEMANDQWNNWIMRNPEKLTLKQKKQIEATTSMALWPVAPLSADLSVREDGSFDHHSHMRGHQGWGMAHLAAITHDTGLVSWSKRLLDFFLSHGTDFGWIPESMTVLRRSETCAVSDVISMASYLAKCGYPEYWDVVERFIRNYIRKAQFFCTSEYVKLYTERHPGEEGEKGILMARRLQGGFQGAMGINDRLFDGKSMDMMGCCAPEGMRAIYTAWINTITNEADGVHVNMCLDCDTKEASLKSFMPDKGGMRVIAKVNNHFWLRPPGWAPKDLVKLYRNNNSAPVIWKGQYIYIDNAKNGETIELSYPLLSFVQKQSIPGGAENPDYDITVTYRGNNVLGVEPIGKYLPLYVNKI